MIPYGRQNISQSDIDAVIEVLRSDFLTQGSKVPAFEDAIAHYCGVSNAISVNSATSALHLACLALGVGSGDLVWTAPISFVASANCARYCGAMVDFIDIDMRTYNLSTDRLAEKLAQAQKAGKLPKVVIPVHLCGQPCDMAGIHALSKRYGFKVIEDASHAIGSRYRGEPVGNCRYSDATVFSFHPVKVITTGEGGMVVTNDPDTAKQIRLLRSHGITRDPAQMMRDSPDPWYYEQHALGFNYRMSDIQAALGLSQMNRLDDFVSERRAIARLYDELLLDFEVVTPWQHPDSYSAFHLYVIRLKLQRGRNYHRHVLTEMRKRKIGVNLHYIPIYLQPYYQSLGFNSIEFPEANAYYSEALSLPIFPGLAVETQRQVINTLWQVLR
jgi:UDP-4-amino-4,6-dideoxy-N-acetyl-beta-L-altrosamine transaminase